MEQINSLSARGAANPKDCWALEDLFADDDCWQQELARLPELAGQFKNLSGTLGAGSDKLLAALKAQDEINQLLEKVYVYAVQRHHEDTGNSHNQNLSDKASAVLMTVCDALSFVEPEILRIPEADWQKWLAEDRELALYRRYIDELQRGREHILDPEMEAVLARVQEIAKGPEKIFSMFNNADIEFEQIHNENGELTELTQGRYIAFLENRSREVRKEAFMSMYQSYSSFKNTLAAAYQANLLQNLFFARMRKYSGTLEMALDRSRIPLTVYGQLIDSVHSYLPTMYRYVNLRKRILGVEELHMYDVHVPIVDHVDAKIPFDQAKQMVKEGLALLGDDYVRLLERGFTERWIDVYENHGKRTGAYSWGAFGTHPYVLLNYNSTLNHVFTLAHEMGHALHSYYSDEAQPFIYAGYKIFVAEVASTCNEALLIHDLLKKTADKKEKAYLINYFLDQFKGTVFRQTMFAEFEKITHQMAAEGASLTAESLSQVYYDLNQQYFGPDMCVDREIAMEWARIPHFYTPFYVYQYATGFAAAIAISQKIIKGEEGAVQAYKKFLSGGGSMDPVDLLKICGVDMTSSHPVEEALKVFADYLKQLEELTK